MILCVLSSHNVNHSFGVYSRQLQDWQVQGRTPHCVGCQQRPAKKEEDSSKTMNERLLRAVLDIAAGMASSISMTTMKQSKGNRSTY